MELNKIYNENCLDTMKRMPDNSIDLIVTSPPYNGWRNRRTQAKKSAYWKRTNIVYEGYNDKLPDEEYRNWQILVINECMRILKPTGTMVYNHKDQIYNFIVTSPLTWILKSNAIFRQRITWDRGGMQAFNNVRFYRNEEDLYILGKNAKGFKWHKKYAKYMSIWKIIPERKSEHIAPFPEEIPLRCINSFTDENDLVYDPFMGSGTTAKVCIENSRNYIGSEISSEYCEIAKKRLSSVSRKLF